nr:MAG TPA: hypothetical protein [Caudoviricetes sp.]
MREYEEYINKQKEYEELGKALKKAQNDFEKTLPFNKNEMYWFISSDGEVHNEQWCMDSIDLARFNACNTFRTGKEAEKERLRRIAVAKINQFRRECQGDWEPDWNNLKEDKYSITIDGDYFSIHETLMNTFNMFGYFRHESDCAKAIELFVDDLEKWLDYETE